MVLQGFGSAMSLRGYGAWEPRWTTAEEGQLPIERGAFPVVLFLAARRRRA